jgi:hypothetical protein
MNIGQDTGQSGLDYEALFEHASRLPCLAIVTMPRAGSDFFQSLLDGHPQILQVSGQFQFYPFWTWALSKETLEDLVEEFIWNEAHLPKFKSQYQKVERWDRLGENRDERFTVEMAAFRRHMMELMKGRELTSRNFFLSAHVAYGLASGARSILMTRLLVCHLHEHYHLDKFLPDFPEATVIYCTRDPRNALVSTVEHILVEPDRRDLYHYRYWLKWILQEAEQVLRRTARLKVLRLEQLHLDPKAVLKEFCHDFGLHFHPCLLKSTYHGKQWWGDARSGRFLKGFNPRIREPNWRQKLGDTDVFLLEVILERRLRHYGYAVPDRNRLFAFLRALALIPLPMRYEIQLAQADCQAQQGRRQKLRSIVFSTLYYLDRVLFYYQALWASRRKAQPRVSCYSIWLCLAGAAAGCLW